MANREYYYENSLTSNVTTSTSNSAQAILSFTPSANNKNVAVYWQALGTSGTSEDILISLVESSNSNFIIQSQQQEEQDSTDSLWYGGASVMEMVSNVSPTTLEIQYRSESGGSVTIRDAYLTVIELDDTVDYWNIDRTEVVTSITTNGDDQYNTLVSLPSLASGNYAITCSASFIDNSSDVNEYDEGRMLLWNDTTNTPYGYSAQSKAKNQTNRVPYFYTACFENTTDQFDFRGQGTEQGVLTVREKSIIALNMNSWPTGKTEHGEVSNTTTSTSPINGESLSITLDATSEAFLIMNWLSGINSTSQSILENIKINGTYKFTANISHEHTDSVGNFQGNGDALWGGFVGIVDLTSGVNTISYDVWSEGGSTVIYGRRNITVLIPTGGFGISANTGGSYKTGASLSVYNSGVWKATQPYVYTSGAWKQVLAAGQGYLGGYVDGTSGSDYDNQFPSVPTPTPTPVCCVVAGTLITMADGSFLEIENIKVGDRVKTMTGLGGLVTDIDTPILGTERGIMDVTHPSGKVLSISDDHDMWVDILGEQQWGTFNYAQWLREAEFFGDEDCPAIELEKGRGYSFAIDDGWTHTSPEFHTQNDPNEQIYGLHLDEGAGYIANGFVVITSGCTLEEIESFRWS